ncbi:MAG: beta-ketoacyl-ACP synthase II [Chloroflexi bacterium]|nr:beta-ketoacyl-ACP synthase II [Chloroflexota bacterium]
MRRKNKSRVVITGLGAVTPVGNDMPTSWRALLAGQSGIDRITQFDPSPFATQIAGEVKDFDPQQYMNRKEARRSDRYLHFAVAASDEALADAQLDLAATNRDRVGVLIGSAIGGIGTLLRESETLRTRGPNRVSPFFLPAMIADTAGAQIAIRHSLRGPSFAVVSACATGGNAIGEAAKIIQRGDADIMIAGGSEAGIVSLAFAGFNVMRALSTRNDEPQRASRPFDATRDGFVIGEGAAVMTLERFENAVERGARIYAEVLGYSTTVDGFHLAAPAKNGAGLQLAIRTALQESGLQPEEVDYINAHGTSTDLNDRNETAAIKAVFGEHAYRLAVSSTKSMIGHCFGASGAIELAICAKVVKEQVIPPTINYRTPDPDCDLDYVPNDARRAHVRAAMSNSMGLGGHNACVILGQVET